MRYTVIIPFYDTIDYIDQSLDSILKQNNFGIKNIQILIINDGSNYDLQPNVAKYKELGLNIEYFKKENGNWGSVINYVKNQHLVSGDYVTILDSDDIFTVNCFNQVEQFLSKNQPDILVGDLAEWKSIKNTKSIRKVLFNFRNKFWNINRHNISKFKTAFSFPIGKFYKSQIFYALPNLKEGVSFQDINLYYESLYKAKTYGYINKILGYRRTDRVGSSTNESWSKRKVDMWIDAIKDMAKYDAVMNALFYTTVKGFRKAYLREYKDKFLIRGKVKTCYIPKLVYIPTYCFIIYLYIRFRKVFKHIY